MTPESFVYWLQGFVELNDGEMPTQAQWKSIVEHLSTIFNKVTPKYDPSRKICSNDNLFIPLQEKYCALGVQGSKGQPNEGGGVQTFKMPAGATGDIGNGIQVFEGNNSYCFKPIGITGEMDKDQLESHVKTFINNVYYHPNGIISPYPFNAENSPKLDGSEVLLSC